MRGRAGWQLWLGGDTWATITWVEIYGDTVLIHTEDGTAYQARYTDAVRCRKPPQLWGVFSKIATRPPGAYVRHVCPAMVGCAGNDAAP